MNPVSRTILFGYFSRFAAVLLSFLLTPIYIKIIGIESFAIVGITFSIQAIILYFDMGFGVATTIETAELLAQKKEKELGSLLRTGELAYWIITGVLWLFFVASSKLVTFLWLGAVSLERFDLGIIIPLMGGVILSLWPTLFYNGALLGLQRSDVLNRINLFISVVKAALSLVVLIYISPTIEAFLMVNIVIGLLQSVVSAAVLRILHSFAKFDFKILRAIVKKSLKFSVVGFLSILLLQVDKILLSRFLSLKELGYYTFCWTLLYGMFGFCGILTNFFGPRFSFINAANNEEQLSLEYHKGCQWMSVLTIPSSLFFVLFSRNILSYWCRDPTIVENTAVLSALLVGGACLFTLCYIPQAFQVARSSPRLTIKIQSVTIIVWAGMLTWFVSRFGAIGAGVAWLILQIFYMFAYIQLMHRQFLKGEKQKWLVDDVAKPALGALLVGISSWLVLSPFIQGFFGVILLLFIAMAMVASSALMIKSIREKIFTNKIRSANE